MDARKVLALARAYAKLEQDYERLEQELAEVKKSLAELQEQHDWITKLWEKERRLRESFERHKW